MDDHLDSELIRLAQANFIHEQTARHHRGWGDNGPGKLLPLFYIVLADTDNQLPTSPKSGSSSPPPSAKTTSPASSTSM